MTSLSGIREVAWLDCPGGGQVVIEGNYAFIGHMNAPAGTSVVDISDRANPKVVATLEMPANTHSHKVRVGNGLMLTNKERLSGPQPDGFMGGLGIFDISDPTNPREIGQWETAGKGVHRFDFDGRYAYISPTVEGYLGNIVMILDFKDPAKPEEVGRWWMPGQWAAGGEEVNPAWDREPRCHHPLRLGDRLYVSYWHAGFVILGIEDMTKPRFISGLDWSPPFPWPTHTTLPIPFPLMGRNVLLVADEDVAQAYPSSPSFLWMVDITDEAHPMPFGSFQIDGVDGTPQPSMSGCHQPCEIVTGTEIPVAWFAGGLRVVDIANPHAPKEVAHFLPDPPPGSERISSNDVTIDDDGLIFLLDRVRGLHILERT